jgi:hypothetical protein
MGEKMAGGALVHKTRAEAPLLAGKPMRGQMEGHKTAPQQAGKLPGGRHWSYNPMITVHEMQEAGPFPKGPCMAQKQGGPHEGHTEEWVV